MLTQPNGKIDASIVIVGDAPNNEEIANGIAFSDNSKSLVSELLAKSGFNPNDCLFVNSYNAKRPYGRQLRPSEIMDNADAYLIPLLNKHPRKMVFALGNTALCATGIVDKPEKFNQFRMVKCESTKVPDTPLIVSLHPFFLREEPEKINECLSDFKYAKRVFDNDTSEHVPIQEIRIHTTSQLNDLINLCKDFPYLAYDFEAADKDPMNAEVLTCSFANGQINKHGEYVGYVWAMYDQLEPLWTEYETKQFKEGFTHLFNQAGKDFDLVAWNMSYDDWVAERWLECELPGSQWDAMVMKWVINNSTYNGLKECVEQYLGYPNYEKPVKDIFDKIKLRRGKVLKDELDFKALEFGGYEAVLQDPVKYKTKIDTTLKYKWPSNVDKGYAGYGLVPLDLLCKYNVLDSVYTWILFDKFADVIDRDNLHKSLDLRMDITREFLRAVQRGFLVDVESASKLSKILGKVSDESCTKIQERALELDPDLQDFNPNSPPQLGKLLFGEPTPIPRIDCNSIIDKHDIPDKNRKAFIERIDIFEEQFYADEEGLRRIVKDGSYDVNHTTKLLIDKFKSKFGKYANEVQIVLEDVYLSGMAQPVMFTKKGKPATGKAVLQTMYDIHGLDILALILMQRKASKLKSTFIDGILNKIDSKNILRGRLNSIGTNSGRASSCVHRDTIITTKTCDKRIVDIVPGVDYVMTHTGMYKKVTDLIYKGKHEMYEVTLENGNTIKCTMEHIFLTNNGWKVLKDINTNDVLYALK